MRKTPLLLCLGLCCCTLLADAPKPPAGPYVNDFQKAPVGPVPEDVFVPNGTFAVREEAGNRFLELAGTPLDQFGVLFGPEAVAAVEVSAKISGTPAGRLYPEFGVGSHDAGGYKLWLMPAQKKVALRKGDDPAPRAQAEYAGWAGGQWTQFRLRVAPAGPGGAWRVEGKVWPAGGKEPEGWAVSFDEPAAPAPGRASAWGVPFADTPIRFDDLTVTPLGGGK